MRTIASLTDVVDVDRHPITDAAYQAACRAQFEADGVIALAGFIRPTARAELADEAAATRSLAYFSQQDHSVYLDAPDSSFPSDDARSHAIVSTKGAVTADQLPATSHLRTVYNSQEFRSFLCAVLSEDKLHEYADPLSSINLNFYEQGQELGWHFDNSEFAVTLLVQDPDAGGTFEYINGMRDTTNDDNNETGVAAVLKQNGQGPESKANALAVDAGTLVLFRGRDALHRVTPVQGDTTRVLVVFAYNTKPGLSLSESARMTFFGRLD